MNRFFTCCFIKIHFNIIVPFRPMSGSRKRPLPCRFQLKLLVQLISPIRSKCPAHLFLFDFVSLSILSKEFLVMQFCPALAVYACATRIVSVHYRHNVIMQEGSDRQHMPWSSQPLFCKLYPVRTVMCHKSCTLCSVCVVWHVIIFKAQHFSNIYQHANIYMFLLPV